VVQIDGVEITAAPRRGHNAIYLEKQGGKWVSVLPQKIATDRLRHMQKIAGQQGPIDDAFTDSFLCVRGTGAAWHPAMQAFADASLRRFESEWDRFFRGKLVVVNDTDVSDADIAGHHLILFGDPASNSLIAQVLDGLPVRWTREAIVMDGKTFDAASHIPALVYPSPISPARYVVLNSGHTFHAQDFLGTNALLYPRLGDYAILKPVPSDAEAPRAEVVLGGLFDEFWRIPQRK
jgi:hypothetical protein